MTCQNWHLLLFYAEDTSIIVTSPNLENYEKQINNIFRDINYWFKLNQLVLIIIKHITYNLIQKRVGSMF